MSHENLNVGYLGYSTVTKEILDAIDVDPELVISFTDEVEATYGRGVAYESYDPWLQVETINSPEALDALRAHDIDVLLVMGWPELLHEDALETPNVGCVGRHLSLLPERRGRAPVAWALIHGLDRTGVSLFWLDEGVDSGPILEQGVVDIAPDDHAQELHDKCTQESITLLEESLLPRFYEGDFSADPQDAGDATYTHPRRPDMGIIDWTDSAWDVHNFVRGQSHPYPGAFSYHEMNKVTAWESRVSHPTVTKAAPGTVLDATAETDRVVVQCGEGTVDLSVEYANDDNPATAGDRLGAAPY
ncbi:methionyl-tRNA formyltransferase [Salinigranum halophilum]|jgi:methionyl-tRNA formyltransferase|uniref:methionyl-tRNA formyltransferase n=1 Tax=Salinigranum halophilum TaxID=2565931 RepID=UPI0010A80E9E|nr:methionyl-tRNA formyltransferase [Salinigranum halophilum]